MLAACGGGSGTSGPDTSSTTQGGGNSNGNGGSSSSTYTVAGTIAGLNTAGLVLTDNGGDNLAVSSGATSFAFQTALSSGSSYAVAVATQPSGATCSVANGNGTISGSNVSSVQITCSSGGSGAAGTVAPIAGTGVAGNANGTGSAASFNAPEGVAVDSAGNLYIADTDNNEIRKITPSGVVTTFAGSGAPGDIDGAGTSASFNQPSDVAVDAVGNVYVSDYYNSAVRKINPAGVVTTVASGSTCFSNAASICEPTAIAADSAGNLYLANLDAKILKVTPGGSVTVFAGSGGGGHVDGPATSAEFSDPTGIAADSLGNVYVSEYGNNDVRKISSGIVTTLAGSGAVGNSEGSGSAASFNLPERLAVDSAGNLYVADTNNGAVRKITPAGAVTTFARGSGSSGSFVQPWGIAVDSADSVYVGDPYTNDIFKILP